MTICHFYAKGYCRYGNNCRFQHIDNTQDYYQKTYQNSRQYDGRHTQTANTSNKIGFSFNKTLDNITTSNTNPVLPQRFQLSSSSANYRPNETQNTSFARNGFQFANSGSTPAVNQRVGAFSFNRTLQQISGGNGVVVDDMDMESTAIASMRPNSVSREPQPTGFGGFSQTNTSFGSNRPLMSPKLDTMVTKTSTFDVHTTTTSVPQPNDDIYSKDSDLTPQDMRQYSSTAFTYKSIPI
ncbi:unnamed protein product, partial [Oppiella nova]